MAGIDFKTLIESAKLTDEQKKIATEVFGIESLTRSIEESAMHTANEAFKTRKAELEGSWETANSEYLDMKAKYADHEATATELAQAKADLAAATEKLKTANPGIDIDKLTKDITAVVKHDAGMFELGRGATELDAIECVAAHRELFGQGISPRALVQEALAAKKPVTEYWEEKYKVADKRTEIAKAASETHDREVEERGYRKAMSEREHPGTRALAPSKDPFWVPKPDGKEALNPWDSEGVPAEETALLGELQAARG